MNIVKVRYNTDPADVVSREYSYYSEDEMNVGDLVEVPTRYGSAKARVTAIGVSESEIERFKDAVKTIPAGSVVTVPTEEEQAAARASLPELTAKMEAATAAYVESERLASTAIINIAPGEDPVVVAFVGQVEGLLKYARERVVTSEQDVKDATNDLTVMAQLTKALEGKRTDYTEPVNRHLRDINGVFKSISEPLAQAFKTTKDKILAYNAEVEKKRLEIERVNREAEELARKQAQLNNGEFTVDTTPIAVPPPAPDHVRTEQGTLGKTGTWDWELEDIEKVPKEYLMVNSVLVGGVVRGSKGKIVIPGIKNIWKPGLRVTAR
jgi:hypothetical protein